MLCSTKLNADPAFNQRKDKSAENKKGGNQRKQNQRKQVQKVHLVVSFRH